MKFKNAKLQIIFFVLVFLISSGCSRPTYTSVDRLNTDKVSDLRSPAISEYCFEPSAQLTLQMSKITSTPQYFLENNPSASAAINGIYYDTEGEPLGIAYLYGEQLANRQGRKSGYFFIEKGGAKVFVNEKMIGEYTDYDVVIATHPLLLRDGKTHMQARETRYNLIDINGQSEFKSEFRSAIGTKNGKNVCFAVSGYQLTMSDWSQLLLDTGYSDALNLDGGPISQLAIRDQGVFGGGLMNTRLMIYAEKK